VQPEFKERLAYMGEWLKTYGATIYGTKAGYIHPQDWGCITQKDNKMYVHVFAKDGAAITLPNFPYKSITKASLFKNGTAVQFSLANGTATITPLQHTVNEPDEVIVLDVN